ncbi:hypothetical protein [Olleya sp. HaHaR_3_96]|nr:hypothetical protein [Olleya sp. HaHaR_3_96]
MTIANHNLTKVDTDDFREQGKIAFGTETFYINLLSQFKLDKPKL